MEKNWDEPVSSEKVRTWFPWSIPKGTAGRHAGDGAENRGGKWKAPRVGLVKGGRSEAR